jgi:hypothetical protein
LYTGGKRESLEVRGEEKKRREERNSIREVKEKVWT